LPGELLGRLRKTLAQILPIHDWNELGFGMQIQEERFNNFDVTAQ
jgi:hypothetical protein